MRLDLNLVSVLRASLNDPVPDKHVPIIGDIDVLSVVPGHAVLEEALYSEVAEQWRVRKLGVRRDRGGYH